MNIRRVSACSSIIKKNTKANVILSKSGVNFSQLNRGNSLYLSNNVQNKNISFGSLIDFLFSNKNVENSTQSANNVVKPPIDDNKPKNRYPGIKIQKGLDLAHLRDEIRTYPEFKVNDGDLSEGNLEKCYMKESEIINSNLSNVSAYRVHLHNSKLINSNLSGLYAPESVFKFSEFTDSDLTDAKVQRSNFQNATFKNTDLTGCDFSKCNLMGADLEEAQNIDTASFVEAVYDSKTKFPVRFDPVAAGMYKFEAGADVGGIYLARETVLKGNCSGDGDDFSGMKFTPISTWLPPTEFDDCRFYGVIFDKCIFDSVEAENANFANCSLYGTKFKDSNLKGANFTGAMFDEDTRFEGDVNLQNAVFLGVDLRTSGIEKLTGSLLCTNPLKGAFYTIHTQFPEGFDPKKAGMRLVPFNLNTGIQYDDESAEENALFDDEQFFLPYNVYRNNASHELNITNLDCLYCCRVDFADSDLSGMSMRDSIFKESYFRGADMKNADCENSDFSKSKLIGANLSGANMRNTDLRFAKLQGAKINDKTDFKGAKYNDFTVFPSDFDEKIKQKMVYVSEVEYEG